MYFGFCNINRHNEYKNNTSKKEKENRAVSE